MDVPIPVSAKRCAAVLGLIVAVMVVASLGASLLASVPGQDPFLKEVKESVLRLTSVDGEGNIPAWYSASLLIFCALLLAILAVAEKRHQGRHVAHWLCLSLIFVFLSLDESAQLHELSIIPLRDLFGATGFLHYTWIVPAAICVAVLVIAYLGFLAKLPPRTRRLFLVAGVVYVAGAIGVEAISGKHASVHGRHNLTYQLIITLEELLEMAGAVVFIYALLDYIGHRFPRLSFEVSSR
jgi:hypothetical protein